jgi:hypothetical protein
MDWLLPALSHAGDRETWLFVIALILIAIIDRRLLAVVRSMERLAGRVERGQAHQTARMQEIRDAMFRLAGMPIPRPMRPVRHQPSEPTEGD